MERIAVYDLIGSIAIVRRIDTQSDHGYLVPLNLGDDIRFDPLAEISTNIPVGTYDLHLFMRGKGPIQGIRTVIKVMVSGDKEINEEGL